MYPREGLVVVKGIERQGTVWRGVGRVGQTSTKFLKEVRFQRTHRWRLKEPWAVQASNKAQLSTCRGRNEL